MTPLAALHHQVANNPDGVAFMDGHDRWTYSQLAEQAGRVARGLLDRGIRKGDRIVLHMPNRPELAVALYACFQIGAIAVPMNIRFKAAELAPLLRRLRPALYIGHTSLSDVLLAIDASILPLDRRFMVGTARAARYEQPWEKLPGEASAASQAPDVHSHAVLLGTSGTTGVSKFVVHTAATLAAVTDLTGNWGIRENRRALLVMPMVHASGLSIFITCIRYGVSMVMLERFEPDAVLEAIETHRCDWLACLPFMCDALLKSQAGRPRNVDSLRFCGTGGDVCPLQFQIDFPRVFGVALVSVWASTEALGSLNYGLEPGPVSRVMKGAEARLVDDAGVDVKPGEVGELLVRGPNISIGYWAGPDAIENAPEDSWWRSGDLMRQDEKDNLWFVSRKKDLIVRGGSNISPVEVEHVLAAHPAVIDAAVVGMPDEVLGQRVAAFVQLKSGATPTAVTDILKAAKSQLADYKVPERLEAIAAIPRNALGKTDRKALVEMLAQRRSGNAA
jgi:acyl-CoA synthetase (AMP-forming)/AMP-acid ligase II